MFGFHKKRIDVVEPAIRGFCYKRAGPTLEDRAVGNLPLDDRIAYHAHAVGVRYPDRTLEKAAFIHPGRASHFAVAVEREPGREDGILIILPTRVEYGHSCACRVAFNHRCVPNRHACNVCDRVVLPGAAFKWNPQIAGAWLGHISPSR